MRHACARPAVGAARRARGTAGPHCHGSTHRHARVRPEAPDLCPAAPREVVIGFLTASIIFSIYSADLGPDLGTALINKGVIDGIEKGVRTWFFVLAFTAIGLSTNFRELAPYFKGGKPLILYVCGQSFNLALTLLMAYVMFYLVFPEITAKI